MIVFEMPDFFEGVCTLLLRGKELHKFTFHSRRELIRNIKRLEDTYLEKGHKDFTLTFRKQES